jgi:cytochrome b involved in lipid metabolism
MKRLTWTAFVVFWSVVLTLVVVAALSPEPKRVEFTESGLPVITLEELAQHDSEDDCWMAIRGVVYNFSEYIPQHPTEAEVLTVWCGKEATEAYETKGNDSPHSDFADLLMEEYQIGVLATD